ncbi:MAG: glycosyl transferase [Gemmatimonadales bacterium]
MNTPDLTVVVPSVNQWSDVEGCLRALDAERGSVALEVLVVERIGPEVRAAIASQFPWVIVLPVGPEQTIPQMRALAFDRASAPSVAVIEDHVLVPPGWARALLLAREDAQVVGGGVRNAATGTLLDWAAFLCEYSHLLPPLMSGPSSWITGNNTVYDRALLVQYRETTHAGRWENYLHDRMRDDGIALISRPEIVVDHKKHYTFGEYFSQRYLYARSYAGARVADAGVARRLAYGLAAFALPPLLLWRTVSRTMRKEVDRSLVWKSVPLTALFVCAWGAGEVMGYWFGAGDSLRKVC